MFNISKIPNSKEIAELFPDKFSTMEGVDVEFSILRKSTEVNIEINDAVYITAPNISGVYRALLNIAIDQKQEKQRFSFRFEFRGFMLDASRNGVPNVLFLKEFIVKLALLGCNYISLYTEDTIEIEGKPLIGFGRGRYKSSEILEIVDFGKQFGITVFPSFQLLGHLEQILKYEYYSDYKDTHRVLNVDNPKIYDFVKEIILFYKKTYKTNLLHIGLDEPWGLGTGNNLKTDATFNPSNLFFKHLKKLSDICINCEVEPIIWGDFILGHPEEDTPKLSNDLLELLPPEINICYWNYFDSEKKIFNGNIAKLKTISSNIILAPGLHSWNLFSPNIGKVRETMFPLFDAADELKESRVLMTFWGDDGAECLIQNSWGAISLYFDACINQENPNTEEVTNLIANKKLSFYNHISDQNFRVNNKVCDFEITPKMMLYDDPVFGLISKMIADGELQKYLTRLNNIADDENTIILLYRLIFKKMTLQQEIYKSYMEADFETLFKLIPEIDAFISLMQLFISKYRDDWLKERKLAGFEVLDVRLNGIIARFNTLKSMLLLFLNRKVANIEEIELLPCKELQENDLKFYNRIYTRSFSIWN